MGTELDGPDRVMAVVMAGLRYPAVSWPQSSIVIQTDIWKGTALPLRPY